MTNRKILLLGEYSGLYHNLKQGLQELGADVTLAANGDAWKKFLARTSACMKIKIAIFLTN